MADNALRPILPPVDPPPPKNQAWLIFYALICSNLFALFVGWIFEFLSLRGVVDVNASRIALFGAWVSGAIIIAAFVWGKGITAKMPTMGGGLVLLAILLWLLDLWAPKPIPVTTPRPIVQFSCILKPLEIDIQPGSEAQIVTLHDDFTVEAQVFSAGNTGVMWPPGLQDALDRHDPINSMDECRISDVGSIGAFNVTMRLTASFLDDESPPKVVHSTASKIFAPSVLPGMPFKFYVVNQSHFWTNLLPGETVTLQAQGEQFKVPIKIDSTGQSADQFLSGLFGIPPTFAAWNGDTITGKKL
jgi:hypothetical protein